MVTERHLKTSSKAHFEAASWYAQISLIVLLSLTKMKLAQNGLYDEATARINEISPQILRSLKANQYWIYFSSILELRRQLYR